MRRRLAVMGVGLGMTFCAVAAAGDPPASAPTAAEPLPTIPVAADDAEAADAPTPLDDIVVTATRREQLQRNVPLAITTLTGAKLAEMGATRFDEYAPVVPGLSFTNCGCTPGEKYTFRGIATDGIKSSLRPLTAVYFDETPITYANGISTIAYSADPDLIDIDRVEIIRGPQGTLFGASAMGGAVRILPKLPELKRSEGFLATEALTITDGGTGYGTSAMSNIPLLQGRLALRGVGYYRARDGFIDTAPLGAENFNDDRTGGARLTGRYEPTDALGITARFAHQNRRSDGGPTEYAYDNSPRRDEIYMLEPNHDDWSLGSVALDFAPGDWRVVSTTSFLERAPYHTRDLTPIIEALYGVHVLTMVQVAESARELTQEIRVQNDGDDAVEWLAGLYFQNQETGFHQEMPAPGFDAATGGDAAAAGLPDNLVRLDNHATIRNYAVFGDVSYRLDPAWEAGVGARVYSVEQEYATDAIGLLSGPRDDSGATDEAGVTPRVSVQFQPRPELSFYSTVAKGFRPGGVNYVSDACRQAQLGAGLSAPPSSFDSDTLWSYEVGAKTSWLDHSLHASGAVFHIDWDDIQIQRAVTPVCNPTDNSGAARANGAELTLTAQPLPRLELELAEAYTDARFAEDSPASGRHKGDPIPDVPRNTFAIAATYGLPHPSSFVRIDYQLRGSAPNDLGGFGNDTLQEYQQVHARLVWSFDRLQSALTVRNLTNERGAFTRVAFPGGPFEIRVPPRTVTFGLQYPF
jgi:iron complex outermembrane recepter protein